MVIKYFKDKYRVNTTVRKEDQSPINISVNDLEIENINAETRPQSPQDTNDNIIDKIADRHLHSKFGQPTIKDRIIQQHDNQNKILTDKDENLNESHIQENNTTDKK